MSFLTKELVYQKTPQELTALLYEAGIDNLEKAISDIGTKQYTLANEKLQKVNDILERLGAGLNYEAGIIADQLDTLYNYMAGQVILGNLKKDPEILGEALQILNQLATAWNEAMQKSDDASQRQFHKKTNAYEQNVMVISRD